MAEDAPALDRASSTATARSPVALGEPLDRWVARAVLLLLGLNVTVGPGLSVAVPAIVLWLPVVAPVALRRRSIRLVLLLGSAAIVSGVVLGLAFPPVGRPVGTDGVVSGVVVYGGALLTVAFVVWACTVMPRWEVAAWYGAAALVGAVVLAPPSANPWKFALAWPVTLLLLAFAARRSSLIRSAAVLAPLALLSVVNDYRSFFGICVMTVAICAWQVRPVAATRGAARIAVTTLLLAVVGLGAYQVGVSLLLRGDLGAANQLRTQTQIDQSGNLLIGGRPEWSATVRLMGERPEGYGFGIGPGTRDLDLAKSGLASLNIATADGYVENYMLFGGFRLHSVVADLWATQGALGLAYGLSLLLVAVRHVLSRLAVGRAEPMLTWLALMCLWDLCFAPTFASLHHVTFSVAMLLASTAAGWTRGAVAAALGASGRAPARDDVDARTAP